MQTNEIEYSVDQKIEGNLKIRMWCFIALYLGTLIGGLIVVFETVMISIGAIIPLVIYTEVLCTWRFVSVEQKYTFETGEIVIYRRFGNSKSKRVLSVKLKDAIKIAPIDDCKEELSRINNSRIYNARPSIHCDNAYAIIYEKDGNEHALLIQVIDKTLKMLSYYNANTKKV